MNDDRDDDGTWYCWVEIWWAVKISIVKLNGMLNDDGVNKRKMAIYTQIVILEKKIQLLTCNIVHTHHV